MEGRDEGDHDKDEDGDKRKGKKNKNDIWGDKSKGKDKSKSKGLPPGLAKRDLPDDLASKMPKRGNNQEVAVVNDDVVLIDRATGVILDVIKDVIRARTGATTKPNGTLTDPGPQTENKTQSGGVIDSILKGIFGGN